MARQPLDPPSALGLSISRAIRREIGDRRMSGRELARILGKAEGYVRARLADKFEFTLADLERFAEFIGTDPAVFVSQLPDYSRDNVTPMRPRRVRGSGEDLAEVASESLEEHPEDTDDQY